MHHVGVSVANGERYRVANYNAHGIHLARRHPAFRKFCQDADLIEVDSTPLIFFTRMLGLHSRPFHRCTYLDWRNHFWSLANREGWRIFYLGGEPGVADIAADRLRSEYPHTEIATHHGYFDAAPGSDDNRAILAQIEAFRPQVLFVGMGMPRQETWLLDHADLLPPCVTFSVGAAFDYEAGVQRAAPRWTGRLGVEWLFRLLNDPRRLFGRYCIEPWALAPAALSDIMLAAREGRLFRSPEPPPSAFDRRDDAGLNVTRLAD
ncbi:MAG TPA: WecB/TagA/CpsF family glycosyltransferase [Phenylobacterium sp.]|nr:WecB/TagA/CpsF family glycosyltransferase [Phenylobacterium sp.]